MQNNTTLYIKDKIAGVVRGEILDIRKSTAHFVRIFGGYGISPSTLDEAEALGATKIKLTVQETNRVFDCAINEWRQYAIPADLGAGRQLFMPLRYFKYCNAHKNELHRNEPVPVQFTLFG